MRVAGQPLTSTTVPAAGAAGRGIAWGPAGSKTIAFSHLGTTPTESTNSGAAYTVSIHLRTAGKGFQSAGAYSAE